MLYSVTKSVMAQTFFCELCLGKVPEIALCASFYLQCVQVAVCQCHASF